MGSCYDSFRCNADNDKDAITQCHAHIAECKCEYGYHGYSGSLAECRGVIMTDEVFSHECDAETWVYENGEKRGPALGIKIVTETEDYYVFGAICAE